MRLDKTRLSRYLLEITKNTSELRQLAEQGRLHPSSLELKAAKYLLIELAEAVSNTIQHILARDRGIVVTGYIDAIIKARDAEIISPDLSDRLRPFFDFRNSLVHRYWIIDDSRLIENITRGHGDFLQFVTEIETYLAKMVTVHRYP
ncbi:MAG: HepT-like ribonuclease domain-containing protein [Pseudomonadota bacterium]